MSTTSHLMYHAGLPAPRLRPYLGLYMGYREVNPQPMVRREFSASRIVVILGWDGTVRVDDPRGKAPVWTGRALIAGPYDSYIISDSRGTAEAIQLGLTPLGARILLGFPLSELTNTTIGLDRIEDRWLDRLTIRLAETAGWPRRFALLDRVLCERLAAAQTPQPWLCHAIDTLHRRGGKVGVGELAGELDLSRRHLAGVFRREFGLPPKTMARLMRFENALLRWESGTSDWARIAAECGFTDQAHLSNEFRRLAGHTPTGLAARGQDGGEGFPFLQDLACHSA